MKIWQIKQCFECANNIPDFFFHIGYKQIVLPRWFRKLVARSRIHRGWLSGITGAWFAPVLEREEAWRLDSASDDVM
ncbi:MAG: hypothetical protein C9356_20175 [Oleiphilus sp.]|nr:MAG: hypothetical protein C9356_20175 [Oleiphilus sp.]